LLTFSFGHFCLLTLFVPITLLLPIQTT
jgi:hypothetical protein